MPIHNAFTLEMGVATLVLIAAYVLIFSEIMHRTSAAIIGAVTMIGVGMAFGFYTQEAALTAIDANTLFLLAGMMMLITLLRPTGGFEYMAIRIAKLSHGDPRRLLVYLSLAVSVISMVLDNVTTVLIFAPLTVLIARLLNLNPLPYLMAEAMLSNIGGTATLVGDPPNIMIGSAAAIDFLQFFLHMGPIIGVIWVLVVGFLLIVFRDLLTPGEDRGAAVALDESRAIVDPSGLARLLAALAVVILLFFIHHHFHLYPSYVAFIGVALALALVRPAPEPLFGKLEWSVLVFFAGLFVLVGGVEASGLLALIGGALARAAENPADLLIAALVLMWVSAALSAIIDNIPFTVTMIPIVAGLEAHGVNITPLWWALAIGVGLGGNGTPIGATANVICIAESERARIPGARITTAIWLRRGLPATVVSLLAATVLFTVFFDYLQ
ncbi:MAG: ArsB/NhaD family transporter [Halothiobacillaceae bacterium]|jgi:Na+/H+ antiporter NhaD/arsenite permease-like protein|nr:ArsB/NhaD family transporter [Halothiobacillaceae bacterium]